MKKLVLITFLTLLCVFAIVPAGVYAGEYGMRYKPGQGGYYDGCRATLTTPPSGYTVSATVKTIIQLKPDSNVQTGWQFYAGWSYPKSFYSYAVDHSPLGFLVEDFYLSDQSWNFGRLYELIHHSSLFSDCQWEIWIGNYKKATVIARTIDGDSQPYQDETFYAGGKTSNSTDRHWARVNGFDLRYNGTSWAHNTSSSRYQSGHFADPIDYNNYYNFLYQTTNW